MELIDKSKESKVSFIIYILSFQSYLYFNLKCETSQYGKAHGTKQGNSYKCQCMHKPGTLKDYKCILKYTRCTLISIGF